MACRNGVGNHERAQAIEACSLDYEIALIAVKDYRNQVF